MNDMRNSLYAANFGAKFSSGFDMCGGSSRLGKSPGAATLTPDPDFGLQTLGNPIGAPWGPVSGSGNAALISAESPFTNVFAKNNKRYKYARNSNESVLCGRSSEYSCQLNGSAVFQCRFSS